MEASTLLPGYRWFHVFRNLAVRTGVYVGVCLTVVFAAWLVLANRVPFLERFALVRNICAGALLGLLAVVPILRFIFLPGYLLASSLVGWLLFSLSYWFFCLFFRELENRLSPFQVFMLGAVVYMIVTTICWIGTIIWKARASHVTHPNNHAS
jgi:cytochrome bd-type quinol oxidase subunit 2